MDPVVYDISSRYFQCPKGGSFQSHDGQTSGARRHSRCTCSRCPDFRLRITEAIENGQQIYYYAVKTPGGRMSHTREVSNEGIILRQNLSHDDESESLYYSERGDVNCLYD